ncbi:MAG: SurA N-terminal domain-containing protein [Prevotellaceae bacterium]|jgi:peptidyl-prolyl cis-trans isomerase D|nr:SurA N-terminal domain-containing protein [Prevotellaceae bacterium]
MAVLEKIRVKFGIFISVLIGIALISFIIDADTLQSVTSMFSSRYDVGSMDGKSISYQDYQKRIDYYSGINQLIMGNSAMPDAMMEKVREQAWQEILQEYVLMPQYKKCGLGISDREMEDLVRGQYISPVLYNDPVFWDENRQFSHTAVLSFVQGINADRSGQRKIYWQYVEKRMYDAQMLEKYLSLIGQSHFLNDLQLQSAVSGRNTMADISYTVLPFNPMSDTMLNVSAAELKAYYKKYEKLFEQETARDIEYVAFPIAPSTEDITLTEEEFYKAYEEFKTTTDIKQFIAFNSDNPFDDYYYRKDELSTKLDSFAFQATAKDVMPVDIDGYTYTSARIMDVRNMADSAKLRHILISFSPTKEAANKTADSLLFVLERGANFGYLAQQHSADGTAARNEGDLGWIQQGDLRNVKNLEDTCFIVPINKYFKIETTYGIHIAQVTERSPAVKKVKLAILTKTAEPGRITIHDLFMKANELAAVSDDYNKFVEFSQEKGYVRVPAFNITESDRNVSIFENARELIRWIYEAKKHTVSRETFNLNNNKYFVVAAITDIRETGVAPFEQVRGDVEIMVHVDKQAERYAQQLKEAMAGTADINVVAEKVNTTVGQASGISFGSSAIRGMGMEPKLVGAVNVAAEQTLSGPVKGMNGVYVFTVDARETGVAYTVDDERMRSSMIYMQNRLFEFLPALEKATKVKDWRYRYF